MTSLWLPWGWMTYEEINNSQKKPQEQREKRVNRKEREAVADCYTYTPRTYIHMSARTHTHPIKPKPFHLNIVIKSLYTRQLRRATALNLVHGPKKTEPRKREIQ